MRLVASPAAPVQSIKHEASLGLVAGDLRDDREVLTSRMAMRAELDAHQTDRG